MSKNTSCHHHKGAIKRGLTLPGVTVWFGLGARMTPSSQEPWLAGAGHSVPFPKIALPITPGAASGLMRATSRPKNWSCILAGRLEH